MSHASWVDLVGYQFEAVHDGAVKALLEGPARATLGSALFGGRVDDVLEARRQRRVGGAVADVVASVVVDGQTEQLAIETKVDSQASRDQMERTARDGNRVTMLALGTSAMRTCTIAPALDGDPTWHIVDVTEWARLLAEIGPLDPPLEEYRAAVVTEAEQHKGARRIAGRLDDGRSFVSRLPREELVGWAWLDETWKAMCATENPGRFDAHKDISGPIFFWGGSWDNFGRLAGGLFIDLMVEGERHLIVMKAADVPSTQQPREHVSRAGLGRHGP
jgi:hypothetical protein